MSLLGDDGRKQAVAPRTVELDAAHALVKREHDAKGSDPTLDFVILRTVCLDPVREPLHLVHVHGHHEERWVADVPLLELLHEIRVQAPGEDDTWRTLVRFLVREVELEPMLRRLGAGRLGNDRGRRLESNGRIRRFLLIHGFLRVLSVLVANVRIASAVFPCLSRGRSKKKRPLLS